MTKWLRRSEYQHALNLARRERRRGDSIAAERWLKHADRHRLIAERFEAFLDAARLREIELEAAYARECAEREQLLRARARASLEEDLRKIEESVIAEEST